MLIRIRRNLKARTALRAGRNRSLRAFEVQSASVNSWAKVAGQGGSTGHGSASRLLG